MKKRRPRIKGVAQVPNTHRKTPEPTRQTLSAPKPIRRYLLQGANLAIVLVVGSIGFVASVNGLFGPFWPTVPVFSLGSPSSGSPFDIPFSIANNSILFPLTNFVVKCEVSDVTTMNNNKFDNVSFQILGTYRIEAAHARPYTCPFTRTFALGGDKVLSAKLHILTGYNNPLYFWRSVQKITKSEAFYLNGATNPPQWSIGESMR